MKTLIGLHIGLTAAICAPAFGQAATPVDSQATSAAAAEPGWVHCSSLTHDNAARLACFDRWASGQATPAVAEAPAAPAGPSAMPATTTAQGQQANGNDMAAISPVSAPVVARIRPCTDPKQSELSRFWELEAASDCGTFGIRSYRPISLSWVGSDSVNTTPSSPAADHTASFMAYRTSEARIQLSVRTKIAQGLLVDSDTGRSDSLWFGYSQQSYWQLFNGAISRPFRTTDHEPEITYIYPTDTPLPWGWRLRYSGVSAVHQSNGQSLPLSRSWNRVVLMAGMEKGNNLRVTARAWARLPESAAQDDNPGISNYIGRAEVAGYWDINKNNTLGMTVRNSLRSQPRGSIRLEWLHKIGDSWNNGGQSNLRFHTQLFTGYGDSLIDYNRRRTVLSVGLSLVDF